MESRTEVSEERDSFVLASDSDDSDINDAWSSRRRKVTKNIRISDNSDDDDDGSEADRHDSDDEDGPRNRVIIDDSNDEDSELGGLSVNTTHEEVPNERLTPTIDRLIRRSIFNISQHEGHSSNDVSEEDDDDDENEQTHNSNEAQEIQTSKENEELSNESGLITEDEEEHSVESNDVDANLKKIKHRSFYSPKSENRTKRAANISEVRSNDTSRNTPNGSLADSITDFEDSHSLEDVIQVDNSHTNSSSNRTDEIVTIDSDSDAEQNSAEYPHEAIMAAKEELNIPSLDPMVAQKRAHIVCKINQIENELRKTKIFLKEGNLNVLPDKGKKLHVNVNKHETELARLRNVLSNIPLIEADNTQEAIKTGPTRPSVENYDPRMMAKPTANVDPNTFGKKALETYEREQALTVDRLEDLHGSLHSRPGEDERAKDPRGLRVSLMAHQQHALAWLLWRETQRPPGGVLADDMGLGKTLTMIALVMAALAKKRDNSDDEEESYKSHRSSKPRGGTLVVCPASLMEQWEGEVKNRCKRGLLTVELYHGNNRERVAKRLARNDIVITTFNLLSREYKDRGTLYNIEWERTILDEAHIVRNHKSQTCEAVCGLHAHKRWALTGTPIHNKEMDLYSILKFLKCSPFDDLRVWKRWVDNKNEAGVQRLSTVMKTLLLRRTKQELMAKGDLDMLPEKSSEIISVALDHEERLVYDKVMLHSKTIFAQFLAQRAEKQHMFELGAGKYSGFIEHSVYKNTQFNKAQQKLLAQHCGQVQSHQILVLLLRLRQVCCHPSLIHQMLDKEDIEGVLEDEGNNLANQIGNMNINESNGPEEDGEVGVDEAIAGHLLTSDNPVFERDRTSSKYRAVLKLTEEILKKGEKLIIVSQWTNNLTILAEQLKQIKGATYKEFTGQVAIKNRQSIVDAFNNPKSDPKILLLSLTAGGVGLNLVGGNHLMLIDIHWNPQLESQAQDRIYRFGQTKNVFIYKFICTDTIEERIKALQEKKIEIAATVLTGSRNTQGSKLTLNDLKSLFNL